MRPNAHLKILMEAREGLSRSQARQAMGEILEGRMSDAEMAALLGALAGRGESPGELAGFAEAMRQAATPLPLSPPEQAMLVDTCGTGGDGCGTFNISTAAALVAAAAGATVAKHGNRAVTSRCGSADVLEAMGIPVDLSPHQGADALRQHGFAFLHAPSLHPAMKAVMPVRRAIGVRTIFNVLGPLTNPAGAAAQVMGVYQRRLVPLVAEAMVLLGVRHAFVVYGETGAEGAGMDEFSISGESCFAEVRTGLAQPPKVTLGTLRGEDLGLERAPIAALAGGAASENAEILHAIFAGERGPRRDVVVLNASAVLVTAGLVHDLQGGVQLAQDTLDRGAVAELVARLARKA